MDQATRVVTVEINGLRYPIRSDLDAAYVADLAAYVEHKMQLTALETPAGDSLKIAVLAALNIADECFRAQDEGMTHRNSLSSRAAELERLLDIALGAATPAVEADRTPLARTAGSF